MQRVSALDTHLRALLFRTERAADLTRIAAEGVRPGDFAQALLQLADLGGNSRDQAAAAERAFDFSARAGSVHNAPARGLYVPFAGLTRDLWTGTSTAGGYLSADAHNGTLINAIRPFSGVIAAGAQVIGGWDDGNLVVPRLDTGGTVEWIAEGASPGNGDPGIGQLVIVPHALCATITITRRLSKQNSLHGAIEAAIFGDLARAAWAEVDRVALAGSGSGEPAGLLNEASVPVVAAGTNGAAPTWELLTEMERAQGENYGPAPGTWGTNSAVREALRNTPRGAGLDYIWPEGDELLGRPTIVTEHVPGNLTKGTGTNLSALIYGDMQSVMIGLWGPAAFDVVIDPYTLASNGKIRLVAHMQVGVGFRHAKAFVKCTDLVTL
jgi:HK97 family phage major capsid protein